MGGRGGSSGVGGNAWHKEIPSKSAFEEKPFPRLSGTPNDVKRSEAIRDQIADELADYAISRTSDGKISGLFDIAIQGKTAIIDDVNQTVNLLGEGKRQSTIDGYKDLARRISAYNDIMTGHTDARWWINQSIARKPENYMHKNLKKIIDGK